MALTAMRLTIIPAALLWTCSAQAADLRVAPATVEAPVGGKTATLNVLNGEQKPLKVQVRVMAWHQVNGKDELTPTQDLVASPPFVSLKAGQRYVIRLVRTAKTPVHGEESYRVLVDEVPEPHSAAPGTVNFVLRQSVPVFFSNDPRRTAKVAWSVATTGGETWLVGRNTGKRRIRVSDVSIARGGQPLYRQAGLLGYVLPDSEMRWPIGSGAVQPGQALRMTATADTGPLDLALEAAPSK